MQAGAGSVGTQANLEKFRMPVRKIANTGVRRPGDPSMSLSCEKIFTRTGKIKHPTLRSAPAKGRPSEGPPKVERCTY
jgi:hypothetical protein